VSVLRNKREVSGCCRPHCLPNKAEEKGIEVSSVIKFKSVIIAPTQYVCMGPVRLTTVDHMV
jgi:hypothetical protein